MEKKEAIFLSVLKDKLILWLKDPIQKFILFAKKET